jgi:hypothetical protein
MGVIRLYSLDCYCDECGRSYGDINYTKEIPTGPGMSYFTTQNMIHARAEMRQSGWVFRKISPGGRKIDLCPSCAKSYKEPK